LENCHAPWSTHGIRQPKAKFEQAYAQLYFLAYPVTPWL